MERDAVLEGVLVLGARDLGPPILEVRDPARDRGRVWDGKVKPAGGHMGYSTCKQQ